MTARARTLAIAFTRPFVVFAGLIFLWCASAYPRGMIAAQIDLSRGRYEVQSYGYPAKWAREYRQLISDRYGVKINTVGGCCVRPDVGWYVSGYNSVAESRIQQRLGRDIFRETAAEAALTWKQTHPQ